MSIELSGAKILIQSIINNNIDTIFGYQGSCVMLVMDCLYDNKEINHILVRHEQGAVHAATGYAQLSGKAGVVLVTSGPAATNTLTGIADTMASATPLVVITGQVSSNLLGTDAFQEVDVLSLTAPITKWNCQIRSADQIADTVSKAFKIATSGRPGAVVLDITKDAQSGRALYNPPLAKLEHQLCLYTTDLMVNLEPCQDKTSNTILNVLKESNEDIVLVLDSEYKSCYEGDLFHSNNVLRSNNFNVLGYGLPAAIGAKYAEPQKTICLISGSMGFQANIQELGVIKQEKLDIKIILLDNPLKNKFEIPSPDFMQLIDAYDIVGAKIKGEDNLSFHIDKMLNSTGSYLLEISR